MKYYSVLQHIWSFSVEVTAGGEHVHNHCGCGHVCSTCVENHHPRSIAHCSSSLSLYFVQLVQFKCLTYHFSLPSLSRTRAVWHLQGLTQNRASTTGMLSHNNGWACHLIFLSSSICTATSHCCLHAGVIVTGWPTSWNCSDKWPTPVENCSHSN